MGGLPRCSGASRPLRAASGDGLWPALTRPVRRSRLKASGREASRIIDARSPRGVEQEANASKTNCQIASNMAMTLGLWKSFESWYLPAIGQFELLCCQQYGKPAI